MDRNFLKTQKILESHFKDCFDVVRRPVQDVLGRQALVVFVDGLVTKETIQEDILRPLVGSVCRQGEGGYATLRETAAALLTCADVKEESDVEAAVTKCLSGDTLLVLEGCPGLLVIQTRGWPNRGIPTPDTQKAVRAPKEAFTETILFNTVLLRRRIKSSALKTKILQVGRKTKTDVCLAWIQGVARADLVAEAEKRLRRLDVEYILESGHIEQLVEDSHGLYPTLGTNEKPDIVAAKLLKGRVAILVDGTPFVLTAPYLFTENFQAGEDYYTRPVYANFLRLLRLLAYGVSALLPGVYVALCTFHQQLLPQPLLATFLEARQGVAISAGGEIFLMLLLYELLREALLRLPTPVAGAVSIAGVFVIGEAAVGAHLIGGTAVVAAAMTFLCTAVVNPAADSLAVLRLFLLGMGCVLGLVGVALGVFFLLADLACLQSFGIPYLLPFAPFSGKGMGDALFRAEAGTLLKRTGMG